MVKQHHIQSREALEAYFGLTGELPPYPRSAAAIKRLIEQIGERVPADELLRLAAIDLTDKTSPRLGESASRPSMDRYHNR